jgi:dTDP-glucose pyrophosphorylase
MKNWEQILVAPSMPLRDALAVIDQAGSQMALVVDTQRRLIGALSDGDVRRGLLKGMSLDDPVSKAMFLTPTVARDSDEHAAVIARMRELRLHQMPIVTAAGIVVGLAVVGDLLGTPRRDSWVVIMAGGLGTRLQQLTRDTPKPMLRVGSRPLLETILRGFADQGFRHFYFAVNYKAEHIECHFGDGSGFGVHIRYLREDQRLGTAGALSLLPEKPTQPFIVTNADLLTKVDCGAMLDEHAAAGADATMAVREYEMQVPFGVVRERDGRIEAIEEKPMQRYTVSAGIYVLSPRVLDLVPQRTFFDMPTLFAAVTAGGLHARGHHIDGYWLDIGHLPDYERANLDFPEVFQ